MAVDVLQVISRDEKGQLIMDLVEERAKELLGVLLLEGVEHPVLHGCAHRPCVEVTRVPKERKK